MDRDMQDYSPPPAEYPGLPPEIAPPAPEDTPEGLPQPEAEKPKRRRALRFLLYAAAALVCLGLLYKPAENRPPEPSAAPTPPAVTAEPEPTPTPAPTPTPEPELALDRVCGTYYVEGMGEIVGDRHLYFIDTGTQSAPHSGSVTIAPAGEDRLAMTAAVIRDIVTTGEGIYICDGNTGSAAFVDSQGYTVTLVFTEENGQITLEVTMVAEVDIASSVGTTTITMTGTKN